MARAQFIWATYSVAVYSVTENPSAGRSRSVSRAQLCGVRSFVSLTCMPQNVPEELSRTIETLYLSESGRILATLARLLGDLDVAEEALHKSFASVLDTWPHAGLPD